MTSLSRAAKIRVLFLGCALLMGVVTARDKSDIITLKNGDRIHGEIVKLEYGKLSLKTDYMGTLAIEWPAVVAVESRYHFDVELHNGVRHFGTIAVSDDGSQLLIAGISGPTGVTPLHISRISAVEDSFWQRIDGSLSFGYNFTKSSDVQVLSGHFDANYRAPTSAMGLKIDVTSTSTPEEGTQDRSKIGFTYQWLRPNHNFWAAVTSFERNEELGIEGRLQAGGGFGHYFHQGVASEVSGFVGAVGNQEWVTGTEHGQQTGEGLIAGSWRIFKFNDPETSLTSSLALYPSFTQSDRYRGNFDASLRQEIIDDFFFELSVFYDYDSQPPGDDPVKDDYGVITSLGYSF